MWGTSPVVLLALPGLALAQALPAVTSAPAPGGGTQWSLSIQTLLLLTGLTFLPAMLAGEADALLNINPTPEREKLYDQFGGMNRDWRRIAETEIGNALNNGQLLTELDRKKPDEEYVFMKGISAAGACPWCKVWSAWWWAMCCRWPWCTCWR